MAELDFDKELNEKPKTTRKASTKGGIKIVKKDAEGTTTEETKTEEAVAVPAEVTEKPKRTRKTATKKSTAKAEPVTHELPPEISDAERQQLVEDHFSDVLDLENPEKAEAPVEVEQPKEELKSMDADYMSEVLRDQALSEGFDPDTNLPLGVSPDANATISILGSRTINLGNYESAKVEVSISVAVPLNNLEAGHRFCSDWVESKIGQALGQGSAPKEKPTQIHGSDEPVTPAKPSNVKLEKKAEPKAATKAANPAATDSAKTTAAKKSTYTVDTSKDSQAGDVASAANYQPGSIHDPDAEWEEDL